MDEKELLINESLLIGVDFSKGIDGGVLIVGRKKKNEFVDVINHFQGQEAYDLYKKLIGE